jgi:muramoyltetrapeptide carboxypeptidase
VLCSLIGSPYAPNFRGRILFLEDVGEKPYRLDRMLTHLELAGVFRQVAGVAAGLWKDCEDPTAATAKEFRQSSQDVLRERLGRLKIPVVLGLPFGHVELNATLPVGARACLDARKGDLIITEAAVK